MIYDYLGFILSNSAIGLIALGTTWRVRQSPRVFSCLQVFGLECEGASLFVTLVWTSSFEISAPPLSLRWLLCPLLIHFCFIVFSCGYSCSICK
ncbi:hypothetical protein KC19_9G076400 [Ceratodon purpureus]|uniref:Uncharacterized protein n=1 Tax=Ceratodon purpureus TaxID=3225 RepID=A0A8T0GTV6_CERPU|nr:hypothetical protein KC19_9G076400 [Ceratodon purpureus]